MLGPNYPEDRIGVTFLTVKAAFGNVRAKLSLRPFRAIMLYHERPITMLLQARYSAITFRQR